MSTQRSRHNYHDNEDDTDNGHDHDNDKEKLSFSDGNDSDNVDDKGHLGYSRSNTRNSYICFCLEIDRPL